MLLMLLTQQKKKIKDCELKLESIKKQALTKESVYKVLRMFDKQFKMMTDFEKKSFVRTFIDSIELYPDKKGVNGCPIKTVHFKFPVAYNGEEVYEISPRLSTTDESVVKLTRAGL